MNPSHPEKILPRRFFADAMLGKLARWLRMLGYDTAYERDVVDEVLIERVLHENRWLLTRDGYLAKRKVLRGRLTHLRSDFVREQLLQLHRDLHLGLMVGRETPSRCPACNRLLEKTTIQVVVDRVPAYVAEHHADFVWCPDCGRVYWPGTHWTHFLDQVEQLRRC